MCFLGSRRPSASLPRYRFHPFSVACGGSSSLGWVLWGGAEEKAFACPQADDGDAFGRRFSRWRHHSFAPTPSVPPWLVACSVVHPVCLPCFTQCRLGSLGRGRSLADGGSLALADAFPSGSCCLVDALPPVVTSSLADALPLFLYSGGCFAAVVVIFGGCFATVSCSVLAPLASMATIFCAGPALVASVSVACLESPPPSFFFADHLFF